MPPDSVVVVALSASGFLGFLVLLVLRIRRNGLHRAIARRWLLIDILLVLMSLELLLDTLVELAAPSDLSGTVHLVAVGLRGASVAGVLALLATFPAQEPAPLRRRSDLVPRDYRAMRGRVR